MPRTFDPSGKLPPVVTPGIQTHIYTFFCSTFECYPGGYDLGVSLLVLLSALQRIIVPLDMGALIGPAFSSFACNVCYLAQVLFPWTVRSRRIAPELVRGGCLPGHASVLFSKSQKFYCLLYVLQLLNDKRSVIYRHLIVGKIYIRSTEALYMARSMYPDKFWLKIMSSLPWMPWKTHSSLYTHPFQILFRDPSDQRVLRNQRGLLYAHSKIWEVVRRKLKSPSTHSHTPLWDNPGLKELFTIPDHNLWLTQGVWSLSDVYCGTTFKSFQQLKDQFNLPNSMHFHYLQLRHALQTQFRDIPPNLEQLDILNIIKGQDSLKLISVFYNSLLHPTAALLAYRLKDRWVGDMGEMEDEE